MLCGKESADADKRLPSTVRAKLMRRKSSSAARERWQHEVARKAMMDCQKSAVLFSLLCGQESADAAKRVRQ